jgi:hypothetical protein
MQFISIGSKNGSPSELIKQWIKIAALPLLWLVPITERLSTSRAHRRKEQRITAAELAKKEVHVHMRA